ncbi:phenylalanine 4-monooxygenase [Litoreibacter roseus]|uniref:Phenylalanine 4-monooxygenase n=1 Tax=Litoreibacter roseus TaxID=2601869 RepID=A0A6N6JJ46_9RHOB|nr:phenylalanine 4-monooxygenase [Litoreibacter roseus]GFE66296.1 phenylalanine 4-monooxygenase [Litoreibacter roseus]
MPLNTAYVSKTPDPNGIYTYSSDETAVWSELYTRQMADLRDHACMAYLTGHKLLGLSPDTVPQVADLDRRLSTLTGAGVQAVDALIPQDAFSNLLKARRFPVATFIRRREDIDYIEEPDIFHEVFGHCPMLTDEKFCRFMEQFGALSLEVGPEHIERLFRLFWFTIEFGLIREAGKTKAFGAGIMSSPAELANVVSGGAAVVPFDLLEVLRTPYRIDIVQPVYFEIESFAALASLGRDRIKTALVEAARPGDRPALFDKAA